MTAVELPTPEQPEVLECPSCGARVQVSFGPEEWRGKKRVRIQSLSHTQPACDEFRNLASDPGPFLEQARERTRHGAT